MKNSNIRELLGKIGFCLVLFSFSFKSVWAQQSDIISLVGHSDKVNSSVFSPNGKFIVTGSNDHTAKLWEAGKGRLLRTFVGHTGGVVTANFSPDSLSIVTASLDSTARIWDVSTGRLLTTLKGHKGILHSANFSSDSKYVVTSSADHTAKVWDIKEGRLSRTLTTVSDVVSAAFSSNSKYVLTVSGDRVAKVWKRSSGKLAYSIKNVNAANFSANGKLIVTADWDGTARIYDTKTGAQLDSLGEHSERVISASFSLDGKYIVTTSHDMTVKIWEVAGGHLTRSLAGHKYSVDFARYSPDGKYVLSISKDSTCKIWEAETGKLLHTIRGVTGKFISADFSPDVRFIITSSNNPVAQVWDVKSGALLNSLVGHTQNVAWSSFSPDGKYGIKIQNDGTTKVFDIKNGNLVRSIKLDSITPNYTATVSLDVSYIAITYLNKWTGTWGLTGIWSIDSGKLLYSLKNFTKFSPDSKYVLCSTSKDAQLYNARDGKLISTYGPYESIQINFSPDGRYIAAANVSTGFDISRNVRIWKTGTNELVDSIPIKQYLVSTFDFSADGKYFMLSANRQSDNNRSARIKEAIIWDVEAGKQVYKYGDNVDCANFSPDGKQVVTAYNDGHAKVWDLATGKLVETLFTGNSWGYRADFTGDGRYILTYSQSNSLGLKKWDSVKIWEVESGSLLRTYKFDKINGLYMRPDGGAIILSGVNESNVVDAATGRLIYILKGIPTPIFSPDGKYILFGDGAEEKIYDGRKGNLLHKYITIDSTDWLAVDVKARYDGTLNARKLLYYVCNTDVIELESLNASCYEPGMVEKAIGLNKTLMKSAGLVDGDVCADAKKKAEEARKKAEDEKKKNLK